MGRQPTPFIKEQTGNATIDRLQDKIIAALRPLAANPLFAMADFQIVELAGANPSITPTFALQYRKPGTQSWTSIATFSSAGVLTATLTGAASLNILKSVLTATGDLIYASAPSTPARLGVGSNGGVLAAAAGLPAWSAAGTAGQLLQSAGASAPAWAGDTAWTAPTLLNGWANFGGTALPAGYFKDASGFVHLRGTLKSGAGAMFNLPAGYRPSGDCNFSVPSNAAFGYIGITASTGAVNIGAGSNAWISLDGIAFDTR